MPVLVSFVEARNGDLQSNGRNKVKYDPGSTQVYYITCVKNGVRTPIESLGS